MKWKKIGHVIVLDKEVDNIEEFLKMRDVKTVVKLGNISGKKREPEIEILAGSQTETIHKENGCLFKLDVAKVMWSKGNINERLRIAKLIQDNENVLDMFAGIGYFTIPAAVHAKPKCIHAIEINPISFKYLNENMKLNKVENIVKPVLGDSMVLAPNYKVDRVLMGYIGNTQDFIKPAIKALNNEGIIHYHESVPEKIKSERPISRIKEAAKGMSVELLNEKVIKKYSPGVVHLVIDVKITK